MVHPLSREKDEGEKVKYPQSVHKLKAGTHISLS